MNFLAEWYSITYEALFGLWAGFLVMLPKVLGALIIFLLGWLAAVGIGNLVAEVLKRAKVNALFNKGQWDEAFESAGIKVDVSEFVGAIIKWALVCVFLLVAVEILGFLQFAAFLTTVLAFVPSVFVSVLIFIVAVILSDICEKLVTASIAKAKVGYARIGGMIVRSSIMGFAFLAILFQLGIAKSLVLTLFTGLVGALALSFGLAFGLGGKDFAREILKEFKDRLR